MAADTNTHLAFTRALGPLRRRWFVMSSNDMSSFASSAITTQGRNTQQPHRADLQKQNVRLWGREGWVADHAIITYFTTVFRVRLFNTIVRVLFLRHRTS